MRKYLLTAFIAAIGIGSFSVCQADTSSAQQPNAKKLMSRIKQDCGADIQNFCKGVTPGEGRIASCLNSKEDSLSDSCKTTWRSAKMDVSQRIDKADVAFRKSCTADVQKFSSDVPSGKGRRLDCLDKHQPDLSSSCKNFQTKLDQKLDEFVS